MKKQHPDLVTSKEYSKVTNAWIDPDGLMYQVGYMAHNKWASKYLQEKFKCDFLELKKKIEPLVGCYGYSYEYLCKKGWFRLLTWSRDPEVVGYSNTDRPNSAQNDTLYLWCSLNNEKYENLFK